MKKIIIGVVALSLILSVGVVSAANPTESLMELLSNKLDGLIEAISGVTVTGPEGPEGPQGIQGEQGTPGTPGSPGGLSVVDVDSDPVGYLIEGFHNSRWIIFDASNNVFASGNPLGGTPTFQAATEPQGRSNTLYYSAPGCVGAPHLVTVDLKSSYKYYSFENAHPAGWDYGKILDPLDFLPGPFAFQSSSKHDTCTTAVVATTSPAYLLTQVFELPTYDLPLHLTE